MKNCIRYSLFQALLAALIAIPLQAAEQQPANNSDDNEEVITLEQFQVSASSIQGPYIASETTAGTRTGEQIINLPYNVQVFTQEFIDDFQLYDDEDLLAFVSGTTSGGGDITIRGFQRVTTYDGFSFGMPSTRGNTQRTEIIKGPMSTLYGRTAPGGIVNKVTKRPKKKTEYNLTLSAGTDDYYYAGLSGTGPIAPKELSNKLFYYAYYQYEHNETQEDYVEKDAHYFGLSFLYMLRSTTSLSLTFQYQIEENQEASGGVIWRANHLASTHADYQPGIRGWKGIGNFSLYGPDAWRDYTFWGFNLLFEHKINSAWALRTTTQFYSKDTDKERWSGGSPYYADTNRFAQRTPYKDDNLDETIGIQTDLVGKFKALGIWHRIILAVDATYNKTDDDARRIPATLVSSYFDPDTLELEFGNPLYSSFDSSLLTEQSSYYTIKQKTVGALLSYSASLLKDDLIILGSLRFDRYMDEFNDKRPSSLTNSGDRDGNSLTYSLGANYKILGDKFLAYSSISTGFLPQRGSGAVDHGVMELIKPYESKGFEFGFKGVSQDNTFGYTVSFFDLEQRNVKRSNDSYVANLHSGERTIREYLDNGVEKARGVDSDLFYKPIKSVTLKFSLGFVDSEIAKNDDEPWVVGRPMLNVGKWNSSILVSYEFDGVLKGLNMGLTATYTDNYTANYESRTTNGLTTTVLQQDIPSRTILKLSTNYAFKMGKTRHKISLLISNLLDKEYYLNNGRPAYGRECRLTYNLFF